MIDVVVRNVAVENATKTLLLNLVLSLQIFFVASSSAEHLNAQHLSPFLTTITKINTNNIFTLKDGREIQLAGILITENGAQHLQKLLHNNQVQVHVFKKQFNDNLPLIVDIELFPNFFLIAELLKSGNALMFPFAISPMDAEFLRKLEAMAAKKNIGIWNETQYSPIISADATTDYLGQYKIIRGIIIKHDEHKKTVYLNFGHDWRNDFTVRSPKKLFAEIVKINHWGKNLTGVEIICRGTLHNFYGPAIDLHHAGQCHIP